MATPSLEEVFEVLCSQNGVFKTVAFLEEKGIDPELVKQLLEKKGFQPSFRNVLGIRLMTFYSDETHQLDIAAKTAQEALTHTDVHDSRNFREKMAAYQRATSALASNIRIHSVRWNKRKKT
jgi:hypothetical protein